MITGAIWGKFRETLYQVLGLESLADRRWSRRLFFFHKIIQELLSSCLQTSIMLLVKERIKLAQQCRIELSQFLQEAKYLRIEFFYYCIKSLSCLRLNFCHLNEHKFRYNFNDMVDLICTCDLETVATLDCLFCCNLYST